jgi:NAD(P)-dependent dehydrogenase (short-subunit alcohol dehydrogenase family)
MKDLSGKVAVVTGAASGIGNAMATRFAAEGMKVVLADIEEGPLADAEKKLTDTGATVLAVPTDVTKGDQMDALAQKTYEAFDTVHVICNNAGVAAGGPMWTLTEADWQWVLGVNLWGVIHGVRVFVPRMVEQGEGHVVNTASMAGLTSVPMMGPYNVSKHGVVTLSETLSVELGLHASPVKVSVLCPGWVNTRIHEADRNRPAELQRGEDEDPNMAEMGRQMIGSLISTGLDPTEVARQVLEAVREERFYILTHPDMKPSIQKRMDDILEGRTPSPDFLGA